VAQQRPQYFPDIFQHTGLSARDRVQAIGLELGGVVGEACQQERHQWYALRLGDRCECQPELADIIDAVIGRQLHADEQYLRAMPAACDDDGDQIGAHGCNRSAAQAVIGAKFDNDNGRLVLDERGGDAVFAAERGLAADAGVDHFIIGVFPLQTLLQQVYPACSRRQAVTGGKAVAEYQNGGCGRGGGRRARNENEKDEAQHV